MASCLLGLGLDCPLDNLVELDGALEHHHHCHAVAEREVVEPDLADLLALLCLAECAHLGLGQERGSFPRLWAFLEDLALASLAVFCDREYNYGNQAKQSCSLCDIFSYDKTFETTK